jgi:hypothetical protein
MAGFISAFLSNRSCGSLAFIFFPLVNKDLHGRCFELAMAYDNIIFFFGPVYLPGGKAKF